MPGGRDGGVVQGDAFPFADGASDDKTRAECRVGRAAGADGKDLPLDRLSAGTGDQIYFAVRLGMIDLLSPDVRLPLILDDAFARYDEERLRKILDLLCQEASSRKILIFSYS